MTALLIRVTGMRRVFRPVQPSRGQDLHVFVRGITRELYVLTVSIDSQYYRKWGSVRVVCAPSSLQCMFYLHSRHFWDGGGWKSGLSIVIWDSGRWKYGPCLLGHALLLFFCPSLLFNNFYCSFFISHCSLLSLKNGGPKIVHGPNVQNLSILEHYTEAQCTDSEYSRKLYGYLDVMNMSTFSLRPPGGSECQFSHFILTPIGRLNYFCCNINRFFNSGCQ